ncbi:hypothetical protein [Longitalea arenae]|uniref:hypothetical protein n=1 Tax=Longitalea arenae TaxID=2812558 RepID=UPI00196858B1|nr:hypothetical protein [Longitalea arenae]
MKEKRKKDSNDTGMNGKFLYAPPAGGPGGNTSTYYQQLPINVILSRLQVQPLIEKDSPEPHVPDIIFQSKRLARLQQ